MERTKTQWKSQHSFIEIRKSTSGSISSEMGWVSLSEISRNTHDFRLQIERSRIRPLWCRWCNG